MSNSFHVVVEYEVIGNPKMETAMQEAEWYTGWIMEAVAAFVKHFEGVTVKLE